MAIEQLFHLPCCSNSQSSLQDAQILVENQQTSFENTSNITHNQADVVADPFRSGTGRSLRVF